MPTLAVRSSPQSDPGGRRCLAGSAAGSCAMAVAAVQSGRTAVREVLERDLVYVTGKGGAGKTTVAATLRAAASRHGRHAVVCEVSGEHQLPASISIDPHDALTEWMRT